MPPGCAYTVWPAGNCWLGSNGKCEVESRESRISGGGTENRGEVGGALDTLVHLVMWSGIDSGGTYE